MKTLTYMGRVDRPTRKTHAGVKQRYQNLNLQQIQAHCNEFLRSRNLPVGVSTNATTLKPVSMSNRC